MPSSSVPRRSALFFIAAVRGTLPPDDDSLDWIRCCTVESDGLLRRNCEGSMHLLWSTRRALTLSALFVIAFFGFRDVASVPAVGAITTYQLPRANSAPADIVAGPDGNLWFTEFGIG